MATAWCRGAEDDAAGTAGRMGADRGSDSDRYRYACTKYWLHHFYATDVPTY